MASVFWNWLGYNLQVASGGCFPGIRRLGYIQAAYRLEGGVDGVYEEMEVITTHLPRIRKSRNDTTTTTYLYYYCIVVSLWQVNMEH